MGYFISETGTFTSSLLLYWDVERVGHQTRPGADCIQRLCKNEVSRLKQQRHASRSDTPDVNKEGWGVEEEGVISDKDHEHEGGEQQHGEET
jgi:hypothetical protein